MILRPSFGAAALLGWLAIAAVGQRAAPVATVTYHQDRPELETQHFTIKVGEDGTGVYHAELTPPKPGPDDGGLPPPTAPVVDRPLVLNAVTTAKVFALARAADRFHVACASKAKNIADTGKKTLAYTGPEGDGECAYNYSEVKAVADLTDVFQGLETTLEIGRRLDFLRRFDRLGLDAEMIALGRMVEEHRACGVEVIGGTLRSIAGDSELLERVRLRAEKLLKQADEERH